MQKQKGAAILIVTVILLLAAILGMVFATQHGVLQQMTTTNSKGHAEAYEAAQGGLDYGLVYLSTNSPTILASAVSGVINYGPSDSNLTNVTLANNSKYSVVYTNPTVSSYINMTITSTGTSADGTGTEVLVQQVTRSTASLGTATVLGSVTSSGVGDNITGSNAVVAGGSVDPNAVAPGGTISANDPSLAGLTGDQLFMRVFGVSKATKQAASTYYATAASVPWTTISGSVWVNDNVSIGGNTTVGSVANPVVLIVNGTYSQSGTSVVNGIVYATGNVSYVGTSNTNGLLVSEGNINFVGTSNLTYNSTIVNNLLNNGAIVSNYSKIPGSWRDF